MSGRGEIMKIEEEFREFIDDIIWRYDNYIEQENSSYHNIIEELEEKNAGLEDTIEKLKERIKELESEK